MNQSKIQILTPSTQLNNNHYMACLWASIDNYGIEVRQYSLDRRYSLIKEEDVSGKVIHLHWIKEFCNFNTQSRIKTLRAVVSTVRSLFLLKKRGNKIVWTVHNTFMHENRFLFIEYLLRYYLSKICDDIIVMSDYSKSEFSRMYGRSHRIHKIPIGNYIGIYPAKVSRSQARKKLKIPLDRKVFLYMGRVQKYKGIDNLLKSFSAIDDSNVTLIIAGACKDPDLIFKVTEAAKNNSRIIAHLSFIDDDDIQYYLNACDWVVLPFKKILNSASVLLALSFRKPVIVPQKGTITELIADDVQGYCYKGDTKLGEAMNRALSTPTDKWKNMCTNAYELAQEYDWQSIGHQLYQVYTQSLGA